jgi:TolB protein
MKTGFKSLLAAILSVILIYSCNQQNSKTSSMQNYVIAYNVLVDNERDNYDIFTVNPENGQSNNITNNPDVAWTYTSFGNRITYISDKDTCRRCEFLYQMDVDGGNDHKITNFKLRDSWMGFRKNGTEIIVSPHESVDSVFYIINLNGRVLKKVNTGLPYAVDPTFSPDGKKIAFRGALKKSKREKGFIDEIYVINEDGTDLKKLTEYPKSDSTAQWYSYKAAPPRWHPTENFISYASFQNGKYSLYGVTPDGKKNWKLTDNPQSEVYHNWSPDGNWLVMDLSDTKETKYQIGLMNWKTKELRILTDTIYDYQQSPVFVLTE